MICNFCGNTGYKSMLILRDIRGTLDKEYHLVVCDKCGLLFLNPQPTMAELEAVYSQDYQCFIGAIEESQSFISRWAQIYGLNRRCKTIIKTKKSGIILDVGCSTGNFLNQMRQFDHWQVVGIEPTKHAAQFAKEHYHLEVHPTELIDAHFPGSKFDVVTMWDVLEHTPNPREQLQDIYRILKPGGLLVIKIPDPSSFEAKIFKEHWVGYDAPVHLFGFPPKVMIEQLKVCGYNKIKEMSLGSDFSTFMRSLNLWIIHHRRTNNNSGIIEKLSESHIARIIAFPLLMTLRYLGMGSSKTYFAWKPE